MTNLRRPADDLLAILSDRLYIIIDTLTKDRHSVLKDTEIKRFQEKATGTWVDLLHAQDIVQDMHKYGFDTGNYNPDLQRFARYSPKDPLYLLKILKMHNIAGLAKGFFKSISPNIPKHSLSLLTLRNHHCHFEPQTADEILRGIDHAIELLEAFGDREGADAVRDLISKYHKELEIDVEVGYQKPTLAPDVVKALATEQKATEYINEYQQTQQNSHINDENAGATNPTTSPSLETLDEMMKSQASGVVTALDYEPWEVEAVGIPDHLERIKAKGHATRVRGIIQEIVEAEGPISLERLTKLTAYGFGIGRVTQKMGKRIKHQISQTDEIYIDADKFVWPSKEDCETYTSFRQDPPGYMRDIKDISPREIANAYSYAESHNPHDQDLTRTVLTYFNRVRQTKAVTTQLSAAENYRR